MWKKKQEKKRDEWMERKESEWETKKKRKEGWNVGIKEFKRKDREREREKWRMNKIRNNICFKENR